MTTITLSLPDSLWEFVESQVAAKRHGNASEYLRGLLREAQMKEHNARLEALLLEGLASAPSPLGPLHQKLTEAVEQILNTSEPRAHS